MTSKLCNARGEQRLQNPRRFLNKIFYAKLILRKHLLFRIYVLLLPRPLLVSPVNLYIMASDFAIKGKANRQTIPYNDYSRSYSSNWTNPSQGFLTSNDIRLLRHVNCSYLSAGKPPSLLALKQHAKSLAVLIRKLSVSTKFGAVGAGTDDELRFAENEAFDWLNDLDEPYENDDLHHHLELNAIHNDIEEECEIAGPTYRCPLKEVRDFSRLDDDASVRDDNVRDDNVRKPYQTHVGLLRHANECLEILDHEYSAMGGILAILPSDSEEDSEEMAGARNTLLGQWILHQQHLVGRMHELEINYARALDLLAGEAMVPMQLLSEAGVNGRVNGRAVAYPQDRFVLHNSSDYIQKTIHNLLDQKEAQTNNEGIWRERGAVGDRMQGRSGYVAVDLETRFYRSLDLGRGSAIGIIPAIKHHDGIKRTLQMETNPTVVTPPAAKWPVRVSEWEKKHDARLAKASLIEAENMKLQRKNNELQKRIEALEEQLKKD